jgi:DDE superfamily endonuclease
MYEARQDQALITMTGLDFATFDWLADKFTVLFDAHTPWNQTTGDIVTLQLQTRGRKRSITASDCLGLSLMWTRTRGSTTSLQIIFGLTQNPVSVYLRFGRRILISVLSSEPDARIRVPDIETLQEHMASVHRRHPLLENVWCTMDGLKLYLQEAGSTTVENAYYNGWKCDHYVSGVIVFCPDGTIPIVCYNVPGSVHDSEIAKWGNIYQKLESVYQLCGGRCTVDSAFSASRNDYLIRSANTNYVGETRAEFAASVAFNAEATSMRQSAEWGMRTFQASFPRIKDRFVYEERGERKRILKLCFLLYNVRARRVGINQLRSVYLENLDRNPTDLYG